MRLQSSPDHIHQITTVTQRNRQHPREVLQQQCITTDALSCRKGFQQLSHAANAIRRGVMQNIRQNLFFAFAYNVLGIPLAAAGLLNPVIAGAAMAASSVSVVGNALLLRRWRSAP